MMQRCYNENAGNYHKYGALGITVCKRWHSFANFLKDMGERPANSTLDRLHSDKGYSKRNCRWASVATQNRNRGDYNQYITFRGERLTRAEWAKRLGITHNALDYRLAKWTVAKALTTQKKQT